MTEGGRQEKQAGTGCWEVPSTGCVLLLLH